MLNERRDGRTHPFVERQSAQESVKFRLAAGPIEAKDRLAAGAEGGLPQPDEVPSPANVSAAAASALSRSSTSDSGTPSGMFNSNCTRNSIIVCSLLLIHTRLGCHLDAVASQPLAKPTGGTTE